MKGSARRRHPGRMVRRWRDPGARLAERPPVTGQFTSGRPPPAATPSWPVCRARSAKHPANNPTGRCPCAAAALAPQEPPQDMQRPAAESPAPGLIDCCSGRMGWWGARTVSEHGPRLFSISTSSRAFPSGDPSLYIAERPRPFQLLSPHFVLLLSCLSPGNLFSLRLLLGFCLSLTV